jgi:hypothetical protein
MKLGPEGLLTPHGAQDEKRALGGAVTRVTKAPRPVNQSDTPPTHELQAWVCWPLPCVPLSETRHAGARSMAKLYG